MVLINAHVDSPGEDRGLFLGMSLPLYPFLVLRVANALSSVSINSSEISLLADVLSSQYRALANLSSHTRIHPECLQSGI